jgi:hypothetical protein
MKLFHRSVVAVCVSVAACSGHRDSADTTQAGTTGASASGASGAMSVTPTGIGPVRAGMTIAELRQALDSVRFTDSDSARCAYPKFVGLPEGVWVMVEQGIVGRVDVQKGDVATAEGIRIGDDSSVVRSVYGPRVTVVPHKYTDGRYLEVKTPGDTLHMIIFETNVRGTVLRYRAGQLPQVRYVESCS